MRQLRAPRTIHTDMVREKNGMYTRQKETCKRDQQKKDLYKRQQKDVSAKKGVSKKKCQLRVPRTFLSRSENITPYLHI